MALLPQFVQLQEFGFFGHQLISEGGAFLLHAAHETLEVFDLFILLLLALLNLLQTLALLR